MDFESSLQPLPWFFSTARRKLIGCGIQFKNLLEFLLRANWKFYLNWTSSAVLGVNIKLTLVLKDLYWMYKGCMMVHFACRQGDGAKSHRSAQRRPADRRAGPGGGGGLQGNTLDNNFSCCFFPFVLQWLSSDCYMYISIPCPGPDSDYNNEDLIQKSKLFFLDFAHMTREKRNKEKKTTSGSIWKKAASLTCAAAASARRPPS